jgi:hypothetical protein
MLTSLCDSVFPCGERCVPSPAVVRLCLYYCGCITVSLLLCLYYFVCITLQTQSFCTTYCDRCAQRRSVSSTSNNVLPCPYKEGISSNSLRRELLNSEVDEPATLGCNRTLMRASNLADTILLLPHGICLLLLSSLLPPQERSPDSHVPSDAKNPTAIYAEVLSAVPAEVLTALYGSHCSVC